MIPIGHWSVYVGTEREYQRHYSLGESSGQYHKLTAGSSPKVPSSSE